MKTMNSSEENKNNVMLTSPDSNPKSKMLKKELLNSKLNSMKKSQSETKKLESSEKRTNGENT